MGQAEDILKDLFSAYKGSSRYKDSVMMEIMGRRAEYEQHLDEMWRIYSIGNTRQVIEYQKQVDDIKSCGLKVLRNSAGKHKIVVK